MTDPVGGENTYKDDPRLSLDMIPSPILVVSTESLQVIGANKDFCKLTASDKKKVIGKHYREALKCTKKPCDKNEIDELLMKLMVDAGAKDFNTEPLACKKPDGSDYLVQLKVRRISQTQATIAVTDVTDICRCSEEKTALQSRLEHFPGMLYTFVKKPNGTYAFTYASAGVKQILGLSEEEVLADGGTELVIRRIVDQDHYHRTVAESENDMSIWRWTGEVIQPNPSNLKNALQPAYRWVKGISSPRKLKDGTIKWDGAVFDVTNEILNKEKVEHTSRRLEIEREREKLAREFAELLSHEVRNPLSGIDSCQLFISENLIKLENELAQPSPKAKHILKGVTEDLEQIRNCTDYIMNILENTLDLAQMRSNMLSLKTHPASLKYEVLQPAVKMYLRNKKGIQLSCTCSEPLNVECDAARIRQILVNLIVNSLKFTEKGYINVVAFRESSSSVAIAIEDSGVGIPEEKKHKVFKKYHRASSSQRGHGIGLALCQGLVQLMGGSISVDYSYKSSSNDPGAGPGTRILIKLPLEEKQGRKRSLSSNETLNVDLPEAIKVLICDDSTVGQKLLIRRLQNFTVDWKFDCCKSAEEALQALSENTYSLIILDEHLYDGGGMLQGRDLMREIREKLQLTTPIIGYSANDLSVQHKDAGADIAWRKPLPKDASMKADLLHLLGDRGGNKVRRV